MTVVRQRLREEYVEDTGADLRTREEKEWDNAMSTLVDLGVPFGEDGMPLGIGWED